MPGPVHDTTRPVLVTGATGFLAGWIVKRLLEEGYTIHATVRDPDNTDKTAHLTAIAEKTPGTIHFFKSDLLEDGSFDAAMKGCAVVMHTASPFTSAVDDPQRDLVDPAVIGTVNVLNSATRTDSVKRVVLTSSCAAIYGDTLDCAAAPGGQLTEAVWNTSSDLDHGAYSYSKTLAEQAAWKIAEAQDRWTLVAVNPSLILGPGLARSQTSESFNIVRQMGNGTMKAGVPHMEIGTVDVRDVAEAHLRAAFVPGANGRNIISNETNSLLDLAGMLRAEFGDAYPFPSREMPKWLVWLVGPLANKAFTRKFVSRNIGYTWRADNTKGIRELGMTYRPIKTSMADMFNQMLDSGQIGRA